jgi:hypothetical protein
MKVEIYAEYSNKREKVAELYKDKENNFVLTYEDSWIDLKEGCSLGPNLKMSQKKHISKELWVEIDDYIPPRSSQTFIQYCEAWGVATGEQDILKLLVTVGHRGPDCFVFEGKEQK